MEMRWFTVLQRLVCELSRENGVGSQTLRVRSEISEAASVKISGLDMLDA
jgi:hypothetical protein